MSGNSLGLDTVGDGDDGEVDIAEEVITFFRYYYFQFSLRFFTFWARKSQI